MRFRLSGLLCTRTEGRLQIGPTHSGPCGWFSKHVAATAATAAAPTAAAATAAAFAAAATVASAAAVTVVVAALRLQLWLRLSRTFSPQLHVIFSGFANAQPQPQPQRQPRPQPHSPPVDGRTDVGACRVILTQTQAVT